MSPIVMYVCPLCGIAVRADNGQNVKACACLAEPEPHPDPPPEPDPDPPGGGEG